MMTIKACKKMNTVGILWFILASSLCVAETDEAQSTESVSWEKVREFYEKARETGEQVPDDLKDWIKTDLGKFGTWEYKIVEFNNIESSVLQEKLNEFGQDRWECFWVERQNDQWTCMLKRRLKSVLRSIPIGDVLNIIPKRDSE